MEKEQRWCTRDSNPGPQDGGRRRIHRALGQCLFKCLILYLIRWKQTLLNFLFFERNGGDVMCDQTDLMNAKFMPTT